MKPSSTLLWITSLALYACNQPVAMKPISLHPQNSHYFLYEEKPTILVTSGEHYGAVINLEFDYTIYLDELARNGLNLTRTFTGAYVEPVGAFNIDQNTLAPAPEMFICPWARSTTPGYANGGNKFDLTKWNDDYFIRLKDFMREAERRKIIVELALFCPFYEDIQWNLSPMNSKNNVNEVGPSDRTHVYTLDKSQGLLEVQEALVRKIVSELKGYNNLIYEICNEPYFGGVTMAWQHHIASLIHEEEKSLSNPHLISQNVANEKLKIEDPHPAVSVFNFHYAYPPVAVMQNYQLNKVIGDNETGFDGNADSTYRREGWSFILGGGALYNNLDYSFTANHENGSFQYPSTQPGGGSASLRKQLGYLKNFMTGLDYLKMKPDSSIVVSQPLKDIQMLVEPGYQYALYLFGKGPITFEAKIPAGTYNVEFINPLNGQVEKAKLSSTGITKITTPPYQEDVAIKIIAANSN